MLNRAIYQKDPSTRKLVNEGVASVNDEMTSAALKVLRYELDTFVCDGQYEKGMEHVLRTYLDNLHAAQQPGVWVSGFYGSGKSHLVKMMRALWTDTAFPDGATARGMAHLPHSVADLLTELSTQGVRLGGLHAASGTLGASASGSVRLAILSIVFKSAGLPEQYPLARFVMWLRSEGILDQVRAHVQQNGYDWQEELDNFYVAEGLPAALLAVKPNLFSSVAACLDTLKQQYPNVADVSNDEMVKAMRQALSRGEKFPLTLLVLDEIQQFIGTDSQRSAAVQEAVETCCKNLGARLLFIGTGQTAVTGTPLLSRLQGRFTVRIELSDADVEAVVRQVILAKQPSALPTIEKTLTTNLGEISRQLAGTTLGHRQDDIAFFAQDYPILPVRRRFWEQTLRVLDQTGAESQLRNQISMVHKAIQTNLDRPVGHVVPADYLYFDAADKLLQTRVLPRELHNDTVTWYEQDGDTRLTARACGLIFLINKVTSNNSEVGIKATVDTLADLMVEDLAQGSAALRSRLPTLLDNCKRLMKVGDEYRIQTKESSAWTDEFGKQRNDLTGDLTRIETERSDRLHKYVSDIIKKIGLTQGSAKVSRTLSLTFDVLLPNDSDKRIIVWVRDGWVIDQGSFQADARQAGTHAPTIFVFIPKRFADELQNSIIDFKAAKATLDLRGLPNSPEGTEAAAAIDTIRQRAESRIKELLDDIVGGARVFQGGGAEITGANLGEMVTEAANNALQRLYTEFRWADATGWEHVYAKAQKGAGDALKAVGDDGEPANNAVCKKTLSFLGGGKRGAEVRENFEAAPYGWSRDAVDGALQVLLIAGLIRAVDERGQTVDPRNLERKAIGKTLFKIEATTITTVQRIALRQLMQKLGVTAKTNEEGAAAPAFLQALAALAERAGGEAPKPALLDQRGITDVRLASGNEQLLALYNRRDEFMQAIQTWSAYATAIDARWPAWQTLQALVAHAATLTDAAVIQSQMAQIVQHRRLLDDPDLVAPLVDGVTQLLRDELNARTAHYTAAHQLGMQRLAGDASWNQLDAGQRDALLAPHHLSTADSPQVHVSHTKAILATLDALPLTTFADRIAALAGRFDAVLAAAAKLVEPKTQFVKLSRPTLKTAADIDAWLQTVDQQLRAALANGPVAIQ